MNSLVKLILPASLFCYTAFGIFMASCSSQGNLKSFHTMNQGVLLNKHFFASVPYDYSSDSAVLIDVTIKGKHYKFMLDTGAPLALSKTVQNDLHFSSLLHSTVKDANGDTTGVDIVEVPDIAIADLQFKNIPALVLDFTPTLLGCDHIDGFVGSNMLRMMVVQFNKPEQNIYFADNIDSFKLPPSTTAIPLYLSPSQSDPHIVVHISHQLADTVLFDSGDKSLYSISKPQFDHFNKNGELQNQVVAEGTGVNSQGMLAANTDTMHSFILKTNISLGNVAIENMLTEPQYDVRSRIGLGVWDFGIVTMDYIQQKFYFTPGKSTMSFTSGPEFGFRYGDRKNKLLVTLVWQKTGAFACGLRPGNEILEFGNFNLSSTPKCEWQKSCRKEARAENIKIKYINDRKETKSCTLKRISF